MGNPSIALHNLSFFVQTFGCQMNKHDSERITGMLESLGMSAVGTAEEADVAIFMTCCVREAADIRLIGQANTIKGCEPRMGTPLDKRIIAIGGCIGQRDGQKLIDEMPHIDIVFGTHNISVLPGLLADAVAGAGPQASILESSTEFATSLPSKREYDWAAWLPITKGCNNFCTYCIVPYVRGREQSRPFEEIVEEAERLVGQGVKEITLLGQNVNSYGRDLYGDPRFAELLRAIDATGIERLRFATSHPKDLSDQVISDFAELRSLMPALHLPVQSGSNRILKEMHRIYTREHYLELIGKVRAACPDIALSTDVIVGFPGETEEDFQATYDLIEQVGYNQVFTFIYSKRAGTPAAEMQDDTPKEVIQERFDRLVNLVQDKAYELNQHDAGKTVDVLIEGTSKRDNSLLTGKSPKNQTVHAPLPEGERLEDLLGTIRPIRIDEARTWYLKGVLA